jgi:hypothetical protein
MKATAPACNARIILCSPIGEISVLPCYDTDPIGPALQTVLTASTSAPFAAIIYDQFRTPSFFAEGKPINALDAQRRAQEAKAWWQNCKREYAMTRKVANG